MENLYAYNDFKEENYFPLIDPNKYPLDYFILGENRVAPIRSYKDDFVPEINEKRYNLSFTYIDQLKKSPYEQSPYPSNKI